MDDCILRLLDKDAREVKKVRVEQQLIGSLKDLRNMKDAVKSLTGSYYLGLGSTTNSEAFIRKYNIWVDVVKNYRLRLQLQACVNFLSGQWKVGIGKV